MQATILTLRPRSSSCGRTLTRLAVDIVPCTNTVPPCGWPVLEVAHHVGAARRLEVGRHAQRRAVGQLDRRSRQVQRHDRHVRGQRRGEHHGHLVVLPRVQVDHVALREELRDVRGEDAEVGTRVFGRLGAGVAGDPQHLAELQLAVLRELAEQAHRSVLEVRERAVGGARAPEAVELRRMGRRPC